MGDTSGPTAQEEAEVEYNPYVAGLRELHGFALFHALMQLLHGRDLWVLADGRVA